MRSGLVKRPLGTAGLHVCGLECLASAITLPLRPEIGSKPRQEGVAVERDAMHASTSNTGGTHMAAPVVWFEIAGRDLDALTRFYGDLLGWKVDADNPQRYGMVSTGGEGGIPGGIYAPGDKVGEYVSFYAEVQGLEQHIERAERLGGKVVQPPMPISETARVAMLLDPEGHRIGLIEQS